MLIKKIAFILCFIHVVNLNAQNVVEVKQNNEVIDRSVYLSKSDVEKIFNYFQNSSLFQWDDVHNNCEDRANAQALMLENWGVPCYKIWIYNGNKIDKDKSVLCASCPSKVCWGYHVTVIIPYKDNGEIYYAAIDPATMSQLGTHISWAQDMTCSGTNYYQYSDANMYIFETKNKKAILGSYKENTSTHYKWTMIGLAAINGGSLGGKILSKLRKKKIKKVTQRFEKEKENKPVFLN